MAGILDLLPDPSLRAEDWWEVDHEGEGRHFQETYAICRDSWLVFFSTFAENGEYMALRSREVEGLALSIMFSYQIRISSV